ncbi:Hypothetical predicted protein [Mytilus galloprovincialis]|uniref:Tyrosinase copper-binding domain-containing protein n=1 Tax=Mytilus galloprovincialis TaxID=29158 RepID=A0A8B6FWG6_MYTGA|nr:Hypothetical predicted protein [Mytilus galloprovincialis]
MQFVFFVVSLYIGATSGLIEPIPLPSSLEECINYKVDLNKGSGVPLHVIQNLCLSKFMSFETPHSWARNVTTEEQNYMRSLIRKVISETERSGRHRFKRNVLIPQRIRREIRAAPFKQWDDYAKAVRRLKFEEIGPSGRSRYDTIADIHMTAINSSHFGPNFLPWHRLYLITMETALGVPIPYWDSSIDYEMEHPTKSIMFTQKYFGNGFGMVKTGPFAKFQTPSGPLIRNIGSDGSLFNKRDLNAIFTRSLISKISEPTAEERVSLEGQHNSIHNWIDGQMNTQEFSPHDPIFWTHHSFVDYIWEGFRKVQFARGIDPVLDIPEPPENVTFQSGSDPSVGLFGFYNREGYSSKIAKMVSYEPHPECPKCCGSPDMYCDTRKHVCVSKIRDLMEYEGNRAEAQEIADKMIEASTGRQRRVFSEYMRDDRVRGDSLTLKKKAKLRNLKRHLMNGGVNEFPGSSPLYNRVPPFNTETIYHGLPQGFSPMNDAPPIQIIPSPDFRIRGLNFLPKPTVDIIYGPIQFDSLVVYPNNNIHTPGHHYNNAGPKHTPFPHYMTDMRTRNHVLHLRRRRSLTKRTKTSARNQIWKPTLENSFFLNGKSDLDAWAFVPVKIIYNNIKESTFQNKLNFTGSNTALQTILGDKTETCGERIDSPLKIFVQSHGLNYYGKYKDFAVYQNRESELNYIAIKKPSKKSVETYISAYDSCGNTCNTRCIIPGVYPPVYRSCAGAISVSSKEPFMYNDVLSAIQGLPVEENIPIVFVCDIL